MSKGILSMGDSVAGLRTSWCLLAAVIASACRIDPYVAPSPPDAVVVDGTDATTDGGDGACKPGNDGDGDSIADCAELEDGVPFTDPTVFNGFHVIAGDKPSGSGTCNDLDDYAEMEGHFDTPVQELNAYAGWQFETGDDRYTDPGFGFAPAWPGQGDRGAFGLRYRGQIGLAAGTHCFRIDIGATDDFLNSRNACGQIYVGVGGPPAKALAETGLGAETKGPATGCVDVPSDGAYPIDVVFWFFDVTFQTAKLDLRHCAGATCTPDAAITAAMVQVR